MWAQASRSCGGATAASTSETLAPTFLSEDVEQEQRRNRSSGETAFGTPLHLPESPLLVFTLRDRSRRALLPAYLEIGPAAMIDPDAATIVAPAPALPA